MTMGKTNLIVNCGFSVLCNFMFYQFSFSINVNMNIFAKFSAYVYLLCIFILNKYFLFKFSFSNTCFLDYIVAYNYFFLFLIKR